MNSSELVSYVRELGSLPDGRFSDAEVLSFCNQEMLVVLQDILSVRSDYLVETSSSAVSSNGFRVPPRALGGKLRDVVVSQGTDYINVPRIDMSELNANATGYFLRGNRVEYHNVVEQLNGAGTVIISYYARPGILVATASCAQVTSVVGTVVSSSGAPLTGFTSMDIVKGTPNFESIYWNQTTSQFVASGPNGMSVANASLGVPSSVIEVGDWVAAAGTSPVPQIPLEFHQVLAQRAIVKALESIGDEAGFQRAQAKAAEMQRAALDLIAERDDGHPEKLRLDFYSPWVYSNRRWWR